MVSVLIASAADAAYFGWLNDLITSVLTTRASLQRSLDYDLALGCFDVGLTEQQQHWLQQNGVQLVEPLWHVIDEEQSKDITPFLRALLAKAFLSEYFPGYDIYLWIDADAWVQDWRAIDLFVQGAHERKGLAIVPELTRNSPGFYGQLDTVLQYHREILIRLTDEETANQLYLYPLLNLGAYALHKNALHWINWQLCLQRMLQAHPPEFMMETVSLVVAAYGCAGFEQIEFLPAWCNWTTHSMTLPCWDREQSCFVERYLPRHPIGILHLSGMKYKNDSIQVVPTVQGDQIEMSLRYPRENNASNPDGRDSS
ncbi:hypothetical protein K9N68_14660 [Kovacikia minuta CCNUW1]|uniref:hypothetical protein n=1 Tax=Kovacikia minuta TaxID=2931930 RepID=UPI001CCAD599|nr:hypothetical protein [Kovacikia minuta]UBF28965.1 hypothetical protein K9N68_14660 [Kovacikia minuta CCNUW1]